MFEKKVSRRLGWGLGGLMAVCAIGACAAVVGSQRVDQPGDTRERPSPGNETQARDRWVVEVPEPGPETWKLPAWERSAPYFPYLPGEDRTRSRSIGDVSHGWLVNAVRIPQPHPHLAVLSVQHGRDLDYTAQETLELVEAAAAHVAASHEDSTLFLGNFSADGGGDIPYSVSHNSGRDADLAFYLLDERGEPAVADDLVSLDDDGKFVAADGTKYAFDVPRNWKLVEGLAKHGRGQIQFVFISNSLRGMLLDYARKEGVEASVTSYAAAILVQPGGALPHNDHFHLRTYCSAADVASGCENSGRKSPGFASHADDRAAVLKQAKDLLDDAEADLRLAAIRRLGLLRDRGAVAAFEAALEDPEPRIRAAAARNLADLQRGEDALAKRIAREEHHRVRAELVWALGEFNSAGSVTALAKLLDEPQPVNFADDFALDLRVLVADALAVADDKRPVEPLIALTRSEDPAVRERAHRALTLLTNFDPPVSESDLGATWEKWHAKHGKLSRDEWLVMGFKAAGLDVPKLALRHVWQLCQGVLDADYLSYNAQRVLMRLSRKKPPSLQWSKSDANFYWRRWFERRCGRLGCPPVPKGMSTLK